MNIFLIIAAVFLLSKSGALGGLLGGTSTAGLRPGSAAYNAAMAKAQQQGQIPANKGGGGGGMSMGSGGGSAGGSKAPGSAAPWDSSLVPLPTPAQNAVLDAPAWSGFDALGFAAYDPSLIAPPDAGLGNPAAMDANAWTGFDALGSAVYDPSLVAPPPPPDPAAIDYSNYVPDNSGTDYSTGNYGNGMPDGSGDISGPF